MANERATAIHLVDQLNGAIASGSNAEVRRALARIGQVAGPTGRAQAEAAVRRHNANK